MKTLLEFISITETFPTAVSEMLGNGWKPQDVLNIIQEIRVAANIPNVVHPKPGFGALPPKI